MVNQFPLDDFFVHSQQAWSALPDHRTANPNMKYAISDAVNSAFSVFFMQSQSFLAHQRTITKRRKGKKNLQTLFQVENVPSDNQIRNLLDPLSPDQFAPQFEWIWENLKPYGILNQYRTELGTKNIALDGMVYHSSRAISCCNCSVRRDRAGQEHYYHATLLPMVVKPDSNDVLTCFPEMITPQDGAEKQDCEQNACKRWLKKWSHLFQPREITYLGDALFAKQPICQLIIEQNQYFIFVCKPDSHVTLYNWLNSLTPETKSTRIWNGSHGEIWEWKWVNDVPLRAGDDALQVNWCSLTIRHEESRKTIYHNSWITNHIVNEQRVEAVCRNGRTRWKIENEGINILKTKGYNVEHNFGHGKNHLSQVLLVLNLLAFLLHTALSLVDDLYRFLRGVLHKRTTFFDDIRALCRYHFFENWQMLWIFMIESLDEANLPSNIASLIPD
ncbi:MAG: ISNCY family transposase [Sphaerospermopsis sp. SIO1G2]|nr:ISNCY family transposase [Sphaerospermopsis sp. SIO1G2]